MKLTILKIILWPKDPNHPPRVIPFAAGKINILSGESGTGKSTLTWIIDYCLGSGKCSIPVGLIREVTGWFGLHVQLPNTEMIIARRNPDEQQTTTDMFWSEGINLSVPDRVVRNARIDDLKNRLNQIALLPTLDFSVEETVGFGGRPSSRDMAAFNFQPQHIVANPYTFFFKADTTEHREKLRIIFPLVLGAIDSSTLATQRELKDLEREHDRWRRELEARLNAARSWEAEIESYYLQARGLGLLAGSPPPDAAWTLDRYMLELQRVPGSVREMDLPDVQEGTAEAAVTELTQLITQEDELAQQIGSLRRRLGKLDQLSSSVNEYGVTLTGQQDRIEGVGWFERRMADQERCPVCAAVHPEGNTQLADLKTLASELKQITESVGRAPPKLDQEIASLRVELRELEGGLSKTRQKRKDVEGRSAQLSAQRQKVRQIYLFVGRVEQALENVAASRNVELLRAQVAALAERIANLRRELDPALQANRLSAAIESVSSRIAHYAQLLRLEHATENVRLNIRELTLQFNPLSGRTDFLWEVGSGQNWVGYHIAGLLALHEHFITVRHNPVPRFLVIDQPSQVYFPEGWPAAERRFGQTKAEDSPDIQGVRRIFQALSHFLDAVDHEFQIIVTEHAGPITWEGVDNVHIVGNWRGNQEEFLIPGTWLRPVP